MAIEFKCPYCPAIIRVPDNAGGGKGRCPKCAMRITVPKKSTVKPVPKPDDDEPFVLDVANEEENAEVSPVPVISAAAVLEAVPAVFDPGQLTKARIGELPVDRSTSATSVAKRLKKKRFGPWAIAGTLIVTLLAAAAFFLLPELLTERVTGNLMAGHAATLDLSPILIEKSRFKRGPEEIEDLLSKLETSPVPLNSNSMQIQLSGTDKGLMVSLAAGPQAHFYRVNVKGNEAVEKYLDRHTAELEKQRSDDVDRAANEFLSAYEKVLAKQSSAESITPFRDSLALTSLVGGFGHQLVAEYGRGLYRCVYEDRDGGLYFLLPEGVEEFRVIGFKQPDGTVVIPADLHVKVEGGIAQIKKSDEKVAPKAKAKKKSKVDENEKASETDAMSGEK